MNTSDKIPVIILAGFLGSGKTTLLNHLLRQSNGRKIGVIVNDFGDVNIDSLLVSKQTDDTMELSGGCICCQVGEGGLDETLESFAHPGSTIDAIIIEASGIAEPADIRKLILYSRNRMVTLGGVVYVVDGANFADTSTAHPEIIDHISAADLLVLSKTDRLTPANQHQITTTLRRHTTSAPIIPVTHGALPLELLLDLPAHDMDEQLRLTPPDDQHDHAHLHGKFSSVSFTTTKPLSPRAFTACLDALPANVYRLKAILYYGMKGFEQKIIIHKVGRHITQMAEEWKGYETPATHIVAIGIEIDEASLRQSFEDCIDPEPDNMRGGDVVDIMRLKGF